MTDQPATPSTPTAAPVSAPTKAMSFNDVEGGLEFPTEEPEVSTPQKPAKPQKKPEPEVEDSDFDEVEDDEDSDDLEPDDADSETDDGDSESESDDEQDAAGEEGVWDEIKKEFDEEGKITVSVNGKDRKYSIAQVRDIVASGAHTLDFRQKVQSDAQKVLKQRDELQKADAAITPAWKAIKDGKLEDAFLELASNAGKSKLDIKRAMRDQYVPVIAEWLGISREWVEQRIRDPQVQSHQDFLKTKEENEYWKNEAQRKTKDQEEAAKKGKQSPGVMEMRKLQSQYGIPDAAIREAVTLLKETGQITGKESDFPVQAVVNQLLDIKAVDRAIDVVSTIRPKMVGNEKFLDSVIDFVRKHPDADQAALGKFVRKQSDTWATKEAEGKATELTKDVSRKSLAGKDKSNLRAPIQQGQTKSRALSFRDYERELEGDLL